MTGTKTLEGKNVFQPGKPAQLTFDIPNDAPPTETVQTQIHVIAGGPCSGKTTLLEALAQTGFRVEVETAERVLEAGIAAGDTAADLRANPLQWQQDLLAQDYDLFENLPVDEPVFTDTSFLETVVFGARAGIEVGPNITAWLQRKRYKTVFFLEPLDGYEQSVVRMESRDMAQQIGHAVRAIYEHHGYELVRVPASPVAERIAFILSFLEAA